MKKLLIVAGILLLSFALIGQWQGGAWKFDKVIGNFWITDTLKVGDAIIPVTDGGVVIGIAGLEIGDISINSGDWVGLGGAKGRIVLTDASVDDINILGAVVTIGDGSPGRATVAEELYVEGDIEADGDVYADGGTLSAGIGGQDGQLDLFSEQGGTDYTVSLFANTAMTSAASFYLPADEAAADRFVTTGSDGIFDYSVASAALAATLSDETGTGVSVFGTSPTFTTSILASASGATDIGSGTYEFGDIYVGDDKKVYWGANQDFSAEYDEDGNDHMIFAGTDINMSGKYLLNEQGKQDLSARGPSLYLTTNDYVEVTHDADIDVGTADFSIQMTIRPNDVSGTEYLINKEAGGIGYGLYMTSDDLYIRLDDNTTDVSAIIGTACFLAGVEYDIHVTFDRDGNATAYVNDAPVGTVAISTASLTLDNAGALRIGCTTAGASFFDGQITFAKVYNRLNSLAEVEALQFGPVSYKYSKASQTSLVTGDDTDFDSDTGFWTKDGGVIISGGACHYSGVANNQGLHEEQNGVFNSLTTPGKKYRITFTISNFSAGGIEVSLRGTVSGNQRTANGTYTEEIVSGGSNAFVEFKSVGVTTLDLDDITIVQIGCVANYSPSSINIAEAKWYDQSGNGLHGAISGAVINNPIPQLYIELEEPAADDKLLSVNKNVSGSRTEVFYVDEDGDVVAIGVIDGATFTGDSLNFDSGKLVFSPTEDSLYTVELRIDGTATIDNIDVAAGELDGVDIGQTTPGDGEFDDLVADSLNLDGNKLVFSPTADSLYVGGPVRIDGDIGDATNEVPNIYATNVHVSNDLSFDTGSIINFNSGDVTLTHSAAKLTWGGDGAVEIDFNNHEMTNVDINSGTINGITDLAVADGGTGAGTFTDGGLLVGAATSPIEALAVGLTTQVLVGGGAGINPAWGTDLPTGITIGTAYIYRAGGTDVPDGDVADNISLTNITQIGTRPITSLTATNWRIFVSAGGGVPTEIALGADGTFLESNGAAVAPAFRVLAAGDIPDISATYEVQLNNEVGLYAVLSDVSDFAQPSVDETISGAYTFSKMGAGVVALTVNDSAFIDTLEVGVLYGASPIEVKSGFLMAASQTVTFDSGAADGVLSLDLTNDRFDFSNYGVNIPSGKTYMVNGSQIASDDLSDRATMAMLDENEAVTGVWTYNDMIRQSKSARNVFRVAIGDAAATGVFTITTTDETGSNDGGSWTLRAYAMVAHESVGNSTQVATRAHEIFVAHANEADGTVATSAVSETVETASAATEAGVRDIATIVATVTQTSNYITQIDYNVDLTGTDVQTANITVLVELNYEGYLTAPVLAGL